MRQAKLLLCACIFFSVPATLSAQRVSAGPIREADRFPATRPVPADTPIQAIEYSDAYGTRLAIHRVGSFAILPLFAAEYLLGDRLINGDDPPGWVKSSHGAVAGTIGAVFALNTVTGVWNLVDSRKDPEGRTRRLVHSALMLASDAGFVYTASIAERANGGGEGADEHREAALASIGLSAAGTLLMWLWKD